MTDNEMYYAEIQAEIEKEWHDLLEELICKTCGSALYEEYGPCGRCGGC